MECCSFTLIIDDLVFASGEMLMAQLGGGGPQALYGYHLAAAASGAATPMLGLASGVGLDLPESFQVWLKGIQAELSGLQRVADRPTARAWQLLEEDGRRTLVWRAPGDPCLQLFHLLQPPFDTLPRSFQSASNYHIGVDPAHPPVDLLKKLRASASARGGVLSVEPYCAAAAPLCAEALSCLMELVDVFSCTDVEAASLVGQGTPLELADRLLACGPRAVAIHRGPLGCVVTSGPQQAGPAWQVPAVHGCAVIDPTGCGNTFCGAFLRTWYHAGDVLLAGVWGNVAASFMIQARGVPAPPTASDKARAKERFEDLFKQAERLR